MEDHRPTVSIIICVRNSEQWIEECLESINAQTYTGPIEVSIFDDGSSDKSSNMIAEWQEQILRQRSRTSVIITRNDDTENPRGVGYAKNRAVEQSCGEYLCFFDSDDILHADRIQLQLAAAIKYPNAIIGSKVCRLPVDSTPRYTHWANNLSPTELQLQVYTCFGPTILMPTWFCSRAVYDKVGSFDQSQAKGVPEDLIFFYRHLRLGAKVVRIDKVLLTYRYHKAATTFSVSDESIWKVRLAELEANILSKWSQFSIWNAGKEGRRFYRSLSSESRKKVVAFGDVDSKKLAKRWYTYEEFDGPRKPKIPIIHYSDLKSPIVICVKLGLSSGNFERNLESLNLREEIDYVHFG